MKKFILLFVLIFSFTSLAADSDTCEGKPRDKISDLSEVLNQVDTELGFETCDLSPKHANADLGLIGFCRNSRDQKKVRISSSISNHSTRTCIIPTYKDSFGNSTYLGSPQCAYLDAGKAVDGRLFTDREAYANYELNSVMIMKEELLKDYFACMDGYSNYINTNCPSDKTNVSCMRNAMDIHNQICRSFKEKSSNQYMEFRI